MMNPPANFLESLKTYPKEAIAEKMKADLKTPEILNHPQFTFEIMTKKS